MTFFLSLISLHKSECFLQWYCCSEHQSLLHTHTHIAYTTHICTHTIHTYAYHAHIHKHHIPYTNTTHIPTHTILIDEFINLTVAHCCNLSSVQFLALTTIPSPLVPFSQESILECKGVRILTVNLLSIVRKM